MILVEEANRYDQIRQITKNLTKHKKYLKTINNKSKKDINKLVKLQEATEQAWFEYLLMTRISSLIRTLDTHTVESEIRAHAKLTAQTNAFYS